MVLVREDSYRPGWWQEGGREGNGLDTWSGVGLSPVEFNASVRALRFLQENDILIGEEITGAKKVLNAAAMTYVTATLATALQLLRLFLLFGRRSFFFLLAL